MAGKPHEKQQDVLRQVSLAGLSKKFEMNGQEEGLSCGPDI